MPTITATDGTVLGPSVVYMAPGLGGFTPVYMAPEPVPVEPYPVQPWPWLTCPITPDALRQRCREAITELDTSALQARVVSLETRLAALEARLATLETAQPARKPNKTRR